MANAPKKRSYQEQWRQAFDQAELTPSPNVWKNIDQQLSAQESGKYKRGFIFYRSVAAVLLLCLAGLAWYMVDQQSEPENIAQQMESLRTPELASPPNSDPSAAAPSRDSASENTPSLRRSEASSADPADRRALPTDRQSSASPLANASQISSSGSNRSNRFAGTEETDEMASGSITPSTSTTLIFPNEEVSREAGIAASANHRVGRLSALPPGALALTPPTWADSINQLYLVPQYRKATVVPREEKGVQLFAGITMAPSLFDPNYQPSSQMNAVAAEADFVQYPAAGYNYSLDQSGLVANSNTVVVQEGLDNQSNLSFSYGFDMGLSLGEHWSLESGLDYQNFQTSTETRYALINLQSGERFPLVAANAFTSRNFYDNAAAVGGTSEVANTFQFVSIPLRLGYNVQFSRFTFSVSPGIAANMFLKNRISSGSFSQTLGSADEGSPFNASYLSGLISGGVFYQIVENYSLSLSPSYQFALSELTRDDASFSSQPQSFGLKLGFRYNFQ